MIVKEQPANMGKQLISFFPGLNNFSKVNAFETKKCSYTHGRIHTPELEK